ncbi:sulfide/dihydroorotate dehydrogenase-like FAD/NAD-binding protein [Haloimpatiens sp. FM7315]|uniref:sulfide/dihydroorotate dehydrogenase-like FAD/NAD-binding protein n=1 Tax=Haloimpatiens sp. FM7315 TaxID=3298609 RepID=UPI00370A32A6
MNYEIVDCIDAGSEFCPCHLAESDECIICSQMCGKKFCDCINWKGVCIYQEYCWNGNKAKEGRKEYLCKIINKVLLQENVIEFSILVSHKLCLDLCHPGSFVFLKIPNVNEFYNTPISIMEADTQENLIKVIIEIKGIKTKKINQLKEGDDISIKGPYWNGVQGIKNIGISKEKTSLIIMNGIGQAPAIPVIKKLYSNGNKIICIVDKGGYEDVYVKKYLEMYNCDVVFCKILKNGELTESVINIISKILKSNDVNIIHIAAQDIMIYSIINYFKDEKINFSCCNNAKMCCGEGICGCCTARYKGHKLKRLCKTQTDPRNLFEGRRFI